MRAPSTQKCPGSAATRPGAVALQWSRLTDVKLNQVFVAAQ
jgi:hypothetical protein